MPDIDPIERALLDYEARDASEVDDLKRIREQIARGDGRARTTALHVTASAFVVHPPTRRVLLRWHARMQMWMHVGGHFDPGETDPWLVAVREAQEETGLPDLRAADDAHPERPVQVVIVPVPALGEEPAHEHADLRYLLVTDRPLEIRAESDAAPLRWLDLTAAIDEIHEENLRVFLIRVAASL